MVMVRRRPLSVLAGKGAALCATHPVVAVGLEMQETNQGAEKRQIQQDPVTFRPDSHQKTLH